MRQINSVVLSEELSFQEMASKTQALHFEKGPQIQLMLHQFFFTTLVFYIALFELVYVLSSKKQKSAKASHFFSLLFLSLEIEV